MPYMFIPLLPASFEFICNSCSESNNIDNRKQVI